jgi:hypothetical protein
MFSVTDPARPAKKQEDLQSESAGQLMNYQEAAEPPLRVVGGQAVFWDKTKLVEKPTATWWRQRR